MHCPSCGSELTSELSYCNRCGVNLKPLSNQSGAPPVLQPTETHGNSGKSLRERGGRLTVTILVLTSVAIGAVCFGGVGQTQSVPVPALAQKGYVRENLREELDDLMRSFSKKGYSGAVL